ncbi:MAG: helix-turn-helix domain-containing protein [Acidimicrobiales bacterium]
MDVTSLDPLVFGERLRHFRRRRDLTLNELGALVGRQASYLSQIENGQREPRLSLVNDLARSLGCTAQDLLDPEPPNKRAELRVALARVQEDPRYQRLRLPYLRPTAGLDDVAIEHVLTLFENVKSLSSSPEQPHDALGARAANARIRIEMREKDNYFLDIERAAGSALQAGGYTGSGAVSERLLTDIATHFGFAIARVMDMPTSTRSICDLRRRVIFVPQRNATGGTRSARSVIAQTLGHFALSQRDASNFEEYVRQRVAANYFAGALLAPEVSVVKLLTESRAAEDISVEDVNELFYVSYEMAAHRITNLITHHLGIPVHFIRSDRDGRVWKAYENDGIPLPSAADGTVEGQQTCRWWGARQAFDSEDAYALHYQYTETTAGTFWCATHIEIANDFGDAITVGTTAEHAHEFRGADTTRRTRSRCPDPSCCSEPSGEQRRRWDGAAVASARDRSQFVSGLPTDTVVFSAHPGVDLFEVYSFLDRHQKS